HGWHLSQRSACLASQPNGVEHHNVMKLSSGDKQLGWTSPRESAPSQSDPTNNPSKNEVRNEVGLDVSHHTRISQRGGEKLFLLTSSFIGCVLWRVLWRSFGNVPRAVRRSACGTLRCRHSQ